MTENKDENAPSGRPYRIRVEGSLDPGWSDRLGGLEITSTGRFGAKTMTVLEGELRDQGALIGILNTLYELRLPLESLETIPPEVPEAIAKSRSSD